MLNRTDWGKKKLTAIAGGTPAGEEPSIRPLS